MEAAAARAAGRTLDSSALMGNVCTWSLESSLLIIRDEAWQPNSEGSGAPRCEHRRGAQRSNPSRWAKLATVSCCPEAALQLEPGGQRERQWTGSQEQRLCEAGRTPEKNDPFFGLCFARALATAVAMAVTTASVSTEEISHPQVTGAGIRVN